MRDKHHISTGSQSSMHPANCVCFGLRSAARGITRYYDEALKPCDLKATQFGLLARLAGTGRARFADITTSMTMDQTTLTRNLRPLQRRELIAIRPGEDRRTREISLTPQGRQLFRRALPLWEKAQQRVTSKLGKNQWKDIRGHLDRLIHELGG